MVVDVLNKQDIEESQKEEIKNFFEITHKKLKRLMWILFFTQFFMLIFFTIFSMKNYYDKSYGFMIMDIFMMCWCFFWMNRASNDIKRFNKCESEYKNSTENNV